MLTAPADAPRHDQDEQDCPFRPAGSELGHLVDVAERLKAKPDLVRHRIRSILDHEQRLAEVAGKSYVHANGFAKIRIVEGRGFCARLHLWPAGEDRLGDVDPHSHRWEFASWVAAGDGMSETYYVGAEPDDPRGIDYALRDYRRDADGSSRFDPPTPARMRKSTEFRRGPGEIYRCPLNVVHTVAPLGTSLVATVVLQGPILNESAKVFRREAQPSTPQEGALSASDLEQLFLALDAAMGESPNGQTSCSGAVSTYGEALGRMQPFTPEDACAPYPDPHVHRQPAGRRAR